MSFFTLLLIAVVVLIFVIPFSGVINGKLHDVLKSDKQKSKDELEAKNRDSKGALGNTEDFFAGEGALARRLEREAKEREENKKKEDERNKKGALGNTEDTLFGEGSNAERLAKEKKIADEEIKLASLRNKKGALGNTEDFFFGEGANAERLAKEKKLLELKNLRNQDTGKQIINPSEKLLVNNTINLHKSTKRFGARK